MEKLRSALDAMLRAAGADPELPQEMASHLGVSRNLTWKASRVIRGKDMTESLQQLPGAEGLDVLIRAALRAGAPVQTSERLREARAALDGVVETHAGDWGTLELMVDGLANASSERLLRSRRLAFEGLSGIWGIQAQARVIAFFLVPSRQDPDRLDIGMAGGMVGVRRLRPCVRWPIFRPSWYRCPAAPAEPAPGEIAMDPGWKPDDGPQLLPDLCSPNMPPVHLTRDAGGWAYTVEPGPVGNTGAFDVFFGTIWPAADSRYRSPADESGDLFSGIPVPVETLQIDAFIHESVDLPPDPEVIARGHLDAANAGLEPQRIPLAERPVAMAASLAALQTPAVPRYAELVHLAASRIGSSLDRFRVVRLNVAYPPLHSTVLMRFRLPERPG